MSPRRFERAENSAVMSATLPIDILHRMLARLSAGADDRINGIVSFLVEGDPVQVCHVQAPDRVVITLLQEGAG